MRILKLLILSGILLLAAGCKDECKDVNCGPNGACSDGTCICDTGYTGTNCEGEVRTQFLGVYEGDLSGCLPDLGALGGLGGGINLEDFAGFLSGATLVASPNADDVTLVDLKTSSTLLGFDIPAKVTGEVFAIPDFEEPLEIQGLSIKIAGSGTGVFVDAQTIQMSLALVYDFGVIPLSTTCTIDFIKQ